MFPVRVDCKYNIISNVWLAFILLQNKKERKIIQRKKESSVIGSVTVDALRPSFQTVKAKKNSFTSTFYGNSLHFSFCTLSKQFPSLITLKT